MTYSYEEFRKQREVQAQAELSGRKSFREMYGNTTLQPTLKADYLHSTSIGHKRDERMDLETGWYRLEIVMPNTITAKCGVNMKIAI